MVAQSARLRNMRDESDDILNGYYYRMLKLKKGRPEQKTRSYKDAVRQVSGFSRVAREAIHSSEESVAAFKAVEKRP